MNKHDNKVLLHEYLTTKNEDAFKKLMENNIKLVHYVINKLSINYSIICDFLEEEYFDLGCLALAHAIEKFDINKIEEVTLSTYAITWIEGKISRELKKRLEQEDSTISMDQNIGNEDDLTVAGTIKDEDDKYEDLVERDYIKYRKYKIQKVFSKLEENEREIVELYYGFKDGKPKTCYRISVILGINKNRIKTILNAANEKLKIQLKEFDLYSYLEKKEDLKKQEIEIDRLKVNKNKLLTAVKENERLLLKQVFDKIDSFEKRVLFLYCGIGYKKEHNIKYISKEMDLDEESVEEIIETTFNKVFNLLGKKKRKN